MSYCVERTRLFVKAGRELATKLLPAPFTLWYSNHDTGTQMTIVLPGPGGSWLPVWKGSVWHSSQYEFNDRDDKAGLQPDFESARDTIEGYFADLAVACAEREAERKRRQQKCETEHAIAKSAALDAVMQRVALSAAAPELYEALQLVWDTYGMDPSVDSSIWQTVRAALAKARGEGTDR